MKSKAPLSLMEQIVMLLVFALAAALCLQVFVLSGQMSRGLEEQDRAVTAVQNTAETVQVCSGDAEEYADMLEGTLDGDVLRIGYTADWQRVPIGQEKYQVTVKQIGSDHPLLGSAEISAQDEHGDEIFAVTVSWQEESHG